MRNYFLLIVVLSTFACHNTNKIRMSQTDMQVTCLHEGNWIFNFKNEVFISCLKKLYPTSFTKFYDKLDASSSANTDRLQYNLDVSRVVDSIANTFIKTPQANWQIEGGKITINVCLDFRMSKELDSLALICYKRFYVAP